MTDSTRFLREASIKDNERAALPDDPSPPFLRNRNMLTVGYAHGKPRTPYLVSTTRAVTSSNVTNKACYALNTTNEPRTGLPATD